MMLWERCCECKWWWYGRGGSAIYMYMSGAFAGRSALKLAGVFRGSRPAWEKASNYTAEPGYSAFCPVGIRAFYPPIRCSPPMQRYPSTHIRLSFRVARRGAYGRRYHVQNARVHDAQRHNITASKVHDMTRTTYCLTRPCA